MIAFEKLSRFKELNHCYKCWLRRFGTKVNQNAKKYSHTIRLPKTMFPQWMSSIRRIELDELILKSSGFDELYSWQTQNVQGPQYTLHDGPPYANGIPHMGHAINKILKDIINRHKLLEGHKVHFVPGWDCHGLPIEMKALKGQKALSPMEIRKRARQFAKRAIEDQKSVFKSWGVMADWSSQCYYTFDSSYVKNQLEQFYKLYEKKFIYRDMKPVYWSPSSKTALAEAELVYNADHESRAVFVGLRLKKLPPSCEGHHDARLLVWTTTPWSLPANEAVAYNPRIHYSLVQISGSTFLVASKLVDSLAQQLNQNINIITSFKGEELGGCLYEHPFRGPSAAPCPLLPGGHVTDTAGTGLVHTAPSHGPDDYLMALEHGLSVNCYVDENGCFTEEAGSALAGLPVLSEGSDKVLHLVRQDVLHEERVRHSYPYDWRTNQPVIWRASRQWFIDTKRIKERALELLQVIEILPKKNFAHLETLLKDRPYWCISRQRVWGVPIPVFYDSSQRHIINRNLLQHYCRLLEREGPDFWWCLPPAELFPSALRAEAGMENQELIQGKDILDIWLDSGLSWSYVLEDSQKADLYLEGIDQFTGWFQSSLLTSVALADRAPYKSILVHGFAVDEQGRKMSKSVGNVVDPHDITVGKAGSKNLPVGVDILRWWVASHSLQHTSIPVSSSTLTNCQESLRKLRNLLKFLLGSIQDLPTSYSTPPSRILDQHMLYILNDYQSKIKESYDAYELGRVCSLLLHFITNQISAFYCHLTKDRLYCEVEESSERRSVQFVMSHTLACLTASFAPILPVLAEEVYSYHPHNKDRRPYFFGNFVAGCSSWVDDLCPDSEATVSAIMKTALQVKSLVQSESPVNLQSSQLHCHLSVGQNTYRHLKRLQEEDDPHTSPWSELSELLQVASASLEVSEEEGMRVSVRPVEGRHPCPRCWRHTSTQVDQPCSRCARMLEVSPGGREVQN